jgi:hypothetical protein
MTIVALGGRAPSLVESSYLPPRLLAIRESGDRQEIIRDQPEVTRLLRQAYGETVKAGKHEDRPTESELSSVIEGLLNRPGFTGECFVQMSGDFIKGVHVCIECLLRFLWCDISDGAV